MKLAVLKERRAHERRVAATPETVKKLKALGLAVMVEAGAGAGASISDAAYEAAGATVTPSLAVLLRDADIVAKVQRPLIAGEGEANEIKDMKAGAILIAMMNPYQSPELVKLYAENRLTIFALELVPRITRAQGMDVLSSQSNLAGYKAVLDAVAVFGRAMPMMMTAAGTIAPARVLVMGAGVAGLQAIATARRLGAIVSATDVRAASKEQVESLGATFLMVDSAAMANAETAGGYAKEMDDEFKAKQAKLIADSIAKQDIVICTALIPGRAAPVLVTEEMVKTMKPGSVIVDLAVEQGGNCPLSVAGEVVERHGVTIVGHLNVPSRLPIDASALYARNVLNFVSLLVEKDAAAPKLDWNDEILKGSALTHDEKIMHPAFAGVG